MGERYVAPHRRPRSPAPWRWNPSQAILKMTKEEVMEHRAQLGVEVHDSLCEHHAPPPFMSFADMGLDLDIVHKIAFREPTPFQAQAIPVALKGLDLFGIHALGDPEFLACILPLIQHCFAERRHVGLVLTPTKELANGIEQEICKYTRLRPIDIVKLVGDCIEGPQQEERRSNCQIIIATPWELHQDKISLSKVSCVLMLEAECLLGVGSPQHIGEEITCYVDSVMKKLPQKPQILLFTHMLHRKIYSFFSKYSSKPIKVAVPVVVPERGRSTQSTEPLIHMLEKGKIPLWDKDFVSFPYQKIIRHLIDKVVELEANDEDFMFGVEHLVVYHNSWKVMLKGAKRGDPGSCRKGFTTVMMTIFRNDLKHIEVEDFLAHIPQMDWNFKLLKFHPLVISLHKKAEFLIAGMYYLRQREQNWKEKYRRMWGDQSLTWPDFCTDGDDVDKWIHYCHDRNKENEYDRKDNEAALRLTRNTLRHIFDWYKRETTGILDEYGVVLQIQITQLLPKLKSYFPRVWIQLFSFLIGLHINPRVKALSTLSHLDLHDTATRDQFWTIAEDNFYFKDTLEGWIRKAISFEPLCSWKRMHDEHGVNRAYWFDLALSGYPSSPYRNIQIPKELKEVLLDLFRKHRGDCTSTVVMLPVPKMLLSRLMVASVRYCWENLEEEDWKFVLDHARMWNPHGSCTVTGSSTFDNKNAILTELGIFIDVSDPNHSKIAETALGSLGMSCAPSSCQQAEGEYKTNLLKPGRNDQILEGVLRLYFFTGVAEAIAGSCSDRAASARFNHSYFWEVVMSTVVNSSTNVIDSALKSAEWGEFSKGPMSSLYTILCSSETVPTVKFAVYCILSSELVVRFAFLNHKTILDGVTYIEEDLSPLDTATGTSIHCMIQKLPYEVFEMDLLADKREHVFLAWSLLLSLCTLPLSSPAREKLIQYIKNYANSAILGCLFQHILPELHIANSKNTAVELLDPIKKIVAAAEHAITTGSLLHYVENLWPVGKVKIASLSGAIFGLMLRVLPASVRQWFRELHHSSASSGIESFTRKWVSPHLIAHELSLIKKKKMADGNFSISINKSEKEIVVTYSKDETRFVLVLCLPLSYPLQPVGVRCLESQCITDVRRTKWLNSMEQFVWNQNGALLEAIRIWKQNVDKEFQRVTECQICFSVFHTANHSLPSVACDARKERHLVHSACLIQGPSKCRCGSPFL